jgi:phosphatidylinositol glycan class B
MSSLQDKPTVMAWRHNWPRYLVVFGALLQDDDVATLLRNQGYQEVWVGNNGFEQDERRRGGVHVLRWIPSHQLTNIS